jgi:hypothetical protein
VDLRGLWDLKEDGQELTAKVLREGRVVQLKVCFRRAGREEGSGRP